MMKEELLSKEEDDQLKQSSEINVLQLTHIITQGQSDISRKNEGMYVRLQAA